MRLTGPIKITAERAELERREYALYRGRVKLVSQDLVLTGDRLELRQPAKGQFEARLTGTPARAQVPAPIDAPWFAGIDIVHDGIARKDRIGGAVFDDRNRNGRLDAGERGIAGVKVSNGREVVKTGSDGRYVLPVRSDMSIFVIQPSGWRVPTNRNFIPQFAYTHKPAGSPKKGRSSWASVNAFDSSRLMS